MKVREAEVRKAASPDLVKWVKEKGAEVVREPGGALVVTEVMLFADTGGLLLLRVVDLDANN
jgi:pumilio homology domain family member 6